MKNYRGLLAIALTLMMVFSIYSMISNSIQKSGELEGYLAEAKALEAEGLFSKAAEKYNQAIALDADITYYHAVTDMYYNNDELENSIAWGEETIRVFPQEAGGYERLIRACKDYGAYKDAFEALETADGRGVESETIEQYRMEMKSLHYLDYIAIDHIAQYSGGYFVVASEDKWGIVSNTGTTILPLRYSKVSAMAGGVVAVCDAEDNWFLAEEDGQTIANITLHLGNGVTDVSLYNDGLFAVCVNNAYTYYDMEFNALPGSFTFAGAFNNGVAAVCQGSTWSLIDTRGEAVNGESYEQIVLDDRGICCLKERIIAKKDGEFLLLNADGKQVGNASFEDARLPAGDQLIAVKSNGLWGFADLNGEIVIEPQYEDAYSFSNGMAAVRSGGLWGYIDEANTVCIEPTFLEAKNMTADGTAFVLTDRGWNILKLYSKNY